MENKIPVLITGVGGASMGEGLIKTLKSAQIPYRIVAVDALPVSVGFLDADSYYQVPSGSDESYLKTILEICEKEAIKVVIPGSEPELKKMSDNREEFKKRGILLLINNEKVIDICMDKWKTVDFLQKNGFLCPASYFIQNEDQLNSLILEIESKLPVIIKPVTGGGASVNTFIAQDREELFFFSKYVLKQGFIPLVQEYVGIPTEEYTVGVLTDMRGKLIDSIALKRQILSGLSSKLKIKNRWINKINHPLLAVSSGYSQGMIDQYRDIRDVAEKIAFKLNSTGPINVQGRKTEKGFYVFEINPRFSGTTVIRAVVGFNEPDILIRQEILKEEINGPIDYKTGIIPRGLREKYVSFEDVKNVNL
jgi:carbamoyl-phosphate synthase large subunit